MFAPPRQAHVLESQYAAADTLSLAPQRALEDSQEWVLFSPAQAQYSSQTQTTSTARTSKIVSLSRLSDFGSLNTLGRSCQEGSDVSDAANDLERENEELDSLDEGLHAFQESLNSQSPHFSDQNGSILPTHDGLGIFPPSSMPVQEQLWYFEHFNPRKNSAGHHRRRSGVLRQLDAVTDNDGAKVEGERIARIEVWRMEQSKLLLDRIESKIRRRKLSPSTGQAQRGTSSGKESRLANHPSQGNTTPKGSQDIENNESLWERITRRIIRTLLGMDDNLLSVIFGESLPIETSPSETPVTSFGSASRLPGESPDSFTDTGWDSRLLDRLARELGILVRYLTDHPGAFNTPFNPVALDYAGIPTTSPSSQQMPRRPSPPLIQTSPTSSTFPHFKPTLGVYPSRPSTSTSDTSHAALWGIEEEQPPSSPTAQDREYWEQLPDFGNIFRVLQCRFSTSHQAPNTAPSTAANIATTATTASLRRAALIRQHHPLVFRATAARRSRGAGAGTCFRDYPNHHHSHHHHLHLSGGGGGTGGSGSASLLFRRPESSCKSLSVQKGRRGGSGSSRNYWDLGGPSATGGSIGSGVLAPSSGVMGAWGEV